MSISASTRSQTAAGARLVRAKSELRSALADARARGRSIGLVPTMGYLHEGHVSLLRAAREACDVVVMSLFVNPAQFGPGEDLERYPRDEERDLAIAAEAGADLVYAPPVEEVYPQGFSTHVAVEGLTEVLCGDPARRGPEHFHGVTTVVAKLLNTVQPDVAYFGAEGRPAARGDPPHGARPRLPGPDRRPADRARARRPGDELAQRLPRPRRSASGRPPSPGRWRAAERVAREGSLEAAIEAARARARRRRHQPEYLEARDPEDLSPVAELNGRPVLLAVAARVGGARLIDNVVLRPQGRD